ncbi:hypothetical protein J7L81_02090 [Candidatus Aerophobetes bacterium]|nr:hypothetical protein [Candidatus Aerophobetes bacterium]
MFFQECESLANSEPLLKKTITQIDNVLKGIGPSSVLDSEIIAQKIGEKESIIEGVFLKLSEAGLLNKEKYILCPKCGNLMKYEDFETAKNKEDEFCCSICEYNLMQEKKLEIVIRYRLKARSVTMTEPMQIRSFPEPNFEIRLPERYRTNPFQYMGLLNYYSNQFAETGQFGPFAGKRFYFILHFLGDFVPFIEAMKRMGLDVRNCVFFYKEYPYPQREAIKNWLEEQDAIVKPVREVENYVKQLATSELKEKNILILEDGGFIVPLVHRHYPQLIPYTLGAVEQTSRGEWNTKEWLKESNENQLGFPVVSVAGSKLKSEFEPKYIGEAAVKNLERMIPNISFSGRNAVVFGFGSIGEQVADWLRKKGTIVKIFEINDDKKLIASEKGYEITETPISAVRDAFLVIGASGRQSIDSSVISGLSHGCYVASASSEQYEIDIEELIKRKLNEQILQNDNKEIIGTTFELQSPPQGKKINLLANGFPVNFWGFESMPEQASDLILSLILLSATEIALGKVTDNNIDSDIVNKIAEEYEVSKKYLEMHK